MTTENAGETAARGAELTPENAGLLAEYKTHLHTRASAQDEASPSYPRKPQMFSAAGGERCWSHAAVAADPGALVLAGRVLPSSRFFLLWERHQARPPMSDGSAACPFPPWSVCAVRSVPQLGR